MHKSLPDICLVLLSLLLLIYKPLPTFAEQTLPSDYTGYYLLSNQEGKKVFGEIHNIMLWKNFHPKQESTLRTVEGPVLDGAIRVNQKGTDQLIRYKITKTSIKANTISFVTEALNGIHYEFKGKFLTAGNFQDEWPSGDVLKGRLIKKQKNKVLNESDVSFTYFGGD